MKVLVLAFLSFLILCVTLQGPYASAEEDVAVREIATHSFRIQTPSGPVTIPLERSLDDSQPLPRVVRALIIVHGLKRNVENEFKLGLEAASDAGADGHGTLVIAPQFLNQTDLTAHAIPADVLRWQGPSWESGGSAADPAPASSFEVLDALVAMLCNRAIFPNLTTIVLAGHSAGGQLIQRYAVVGKAEQLAAAQGIRVRFVIANPSSYLYFSDDRPLLSKGHFQFAPFQAADCPEFHQWKYGFLNGPPYVALGAASDWRKTEDDYAQRDVIYLLGTADTDPNHPELDKSCSAEAEGPTRFTRGQMYFLYLHARHLSGWNQRLRFVPHAGHSAEDMFISQCGLASLFDHGKCPDQ